MSSHDYTGLILMIALLFTALVFLMDDSAVLGGAVIAAPTILWLTYVQYRRQPEAAS